MTNSGKLFTVCIESAQVIGHSYYPLPFSSKLFYCETFDSADSTKVLSIEDRHIKEKLNVLSYK